jgi:hypothetical protein
MGNVRSANRRFGVQATEMTDMRRAVAILLGMGFSAAAQGAQIQGVIADWNCVQPMVQQGREKVLKRRRSCSLMKEYKRGAYGLITDDRKFYRLDDAGNHHVLELLGNTPDKDNLKVVVTGDLEGNTIKVANMSIL